MTIADRLTSRSWKQALAVYLAFCVAHYLLSLVVLFATAMTVFVSERPGDITPPGWILIVLSIIVRPFWSACFTLELYMGSTVMVDFPYIASGVVDSLAWGALLCVAIVWRRRSSQEGPTP